jgi:hypothetical protein
MVGAGNCRASDRAGLKGAHNSAAAGLRQRGLGARREAKGTLFSDPIFLRGFLSPFVVRVPIVQMAILAGFVDTVDRLK